MLTIEYFIFYIIAYFIQGVGYYLKRVSFIMRNKIFDILKQERCWLFFCNYPCNIKKQSSLCFIFEAVMFSQSVFFRNASN